MKSRVFLLKILLLSFFVAKGAMASQDGSVLSINGMTTDSEAEAIAACRQKLNERIDLTWSTAEALEVFDELSKSDLGKSLIVKKGTNCESINHLIRINSTSEAQARLTPLEKWLVNEAPSILALQERFEILASQLNRFSELGVIFTFVPHNWTEELAMANHGDLDRCMIDLYKKYYNSFIPNEVLITSFLSSPPYVSQESCWKLIDMSNVRKQQVIFEEILNITPYFRTEEQTVNQLEQAGFKVKEIIHDSRWISPTVVAIKQCD